MAEQQRVEQIDETSRLLSRDDLGKAGRQSGAPGAVSSIHGLRRTAMTTYLVGCSLLVLGAVQVTPDDVGLAAVLLPVAVLAIVLAIGCHLRLRRLGSELVRPEA